MASSIVGCAPKSGEKKQQIEEIRKDLIETIMETEQDADILYIKEFNDAMLRNDLDKSLYSLAKAYESRCKYMRRNESLGRLEENAYGLLPEIKEFGNKFGKDTKLQEIQKMASYGEFGMGNNTPGSSIRIILNRVETLKKNNKD